MQVRVGKLPYKARDWLRPISSPLDCARIDRRFVNPPPDDSQLMNGKTHTAFSAI